MVRFVVYVAVRDGNTMSQVPLGVCAVVNERRFPLDAALPVAGPGLRRRRSIQRQGLSSEVLRATTK